MTNAIVPFALNGERKDLIKRTIAKDATDDELALFFYQVERTGLDPFARQIYAIKRWDNQQKRFVMQTQVGIDGMRLVAARTGEYDSQDGPYWADEDGNWHDVWLKKEPPTAAKVLVYKRGSSRGTAGIAHWREYRQVDKQGNLTPMWAKMPANMLAKCAEALALRKAFPQELSGLYTAEEMAQAENPEVVVEATVVQNGNGAKAIVQWEQDQEESVSDQGGAAVPGITTEQRKKLHAIGRKIYGELWDAVRAEDVEVFSAGRTTSSSELTYQEAEDYITFLEIEQAGNELYGMDWMGKRTEIAMKVTLDESNDLRHAQSKELQRVLAGLNRRLLEKAAADAARAA